MARRQEEHPAEQNHTSTTKSLESVCGNAKSTHATTSYFEPPLQASVWLPEDGAGVGVLFEGTFDEKLGGSRVCRA